MGRHHHAIPVPFKVAYGKHDGRYANWDDGGENKPHKGWIGVGWAYDVERGGDAVYATALQKDPGVQLDEDGNIPDSFQYDENKLVFLVNSEESDSITAFAFMEETIEMFRRDFGLGEITRDTTVQQYI